MERKQKQILVCYMVKILSSLKMGNVQGNCSQTERTNLHKSNGSFSFWNKQKENLIKLYKIQNLSVGEISKTYKCDSSTIYRWLKYFGLYEKKERYNAKYSLDTKYFDNIDSEQKAYILGYILSDGHVSSSTLMLCCKDFDILEKISNELQYGGRIKTKNNGLSELNITSKRITNKLKEYGYNNSKSYYININKILEFIPSELIRHFVRGMFDGDGSICTYKYSYIKNIQYHLGYTGTKEVVDFIYKTFGLHTKIVVEGKFTFTCVTSCKKDVIRILHYMYDNSHIYIDRKYRKYLEVCEQDLQRL